VAKDMTLTSRLYRLARLGRDVKAVERCIETGSPKPLLKRIVNKAIGRVIVRRLWWR
jgi:hypothetical protein